MSYSVLGKKFGFFGSGQDSAGVARSVTANVTTVLRNKGDLRGAQVDIVQTGRRGFGWDSGINKTAISKKWGTPPDAPTSADSDGQGGDPSNSGSGRGY